MPKQYRTHTVVNAAGYSEVRERDKLFRSAKKTLGKASRTVNEDELGELLETLQEIAASLKGRTSNEVEERDEDEVEEIDNEDDEDEVRRPPVDKEEVFKAMRANSRDDSVQRALRNDPRYAGQQRDRRHVENERKRSGNPIINAMTEYRDNNSSDAVVRELRRKGR